MARTALMHTRDPFAVDQDNALEVLRAELGEWYGICVSDGKWHARQKEAPRALLTAGTPGELRQAARAHLGLR